MTCRAGRESRVRGSKPQIRTPIGVSTIRRTPASFRVTKWRAGGCAAVPFSLSQLPLTAVAMLKMGMYSATTMPPMTTPRNAISSGSISEVSASVMACTSSS